MTTVEEAFDLLADASDVRYPYPDRQNKGYCPAHDDHNNPGLSFTISSTTGNLLVHCFAQECSVTDVAMSIGVTPAAFFVGQGGHRIDSGIVVRYESTLELLKLLPLNYSWDEQQEAVFRVLAACVTMTEGNEDEDATWECEKPYHDVTYPVMRDVLLYEWCLPHWTKTREKWITKDRTGYADGAMRLIRQLSKETRRNNVTEVTA